MYSVVARMFSQILNEKTSIKYLKKVLITYLNALELEITFFFAFVGT